MLPTDAEVSDGQGNPSRGFIAALTSGLHWLGQNLGLGQAHAGKKRPTPPSPKAPPYKLRGCASLAGRISTRSNATRINNMADPTGVPRPWAKNMAGMEWAYKQLTAMGKDREASQLMASILHYDQQQSVAHADEAFKALWHGDGQQAADEINRGADALTDGRHIHVDWDDKTKQYTITGSKLDGQTLWKQLATPEAMLNYLEGARNGSTQWMSYEDQAAKYDGTYKSMADARKRAIAGRDKTDADQAAQAQANDQIAKFGP